MLGRLRASRGRPSPRARAIALGVLLVGVAALALVPIQSGGAGEHRSSARAMTRPTRGPDRPRVPDAQVARARGVARTFLAGYLRFAYGRASAASVLALTPGLRRQLITERAQVPPVARRRRPRVVSLAAVGQGPGVAVAVALVDDGGITSYAVRLTVQRSRRGWLVSRVDGG